MGLEIPPRARYLRTLWHELSRVHSHLLWAGLGADALGFESLFMHCWRLRETVLDLFERTTGGRVIFSVCKVGGCRRDISDADLKFMRQTLQTFRKDVVETADIFIHDETIQSRLMGVGVLPKELAMEMGCVGPFLRASGVASDYRCAEEGGAYRELGFEPIVETGGDCFARAVVRLRETLQSIDLMLGCLDNLPEGPVDVPVKGFPPKAEYFTRMEQPRGEAVYYVKGSGKANLERFRLRTPTNANLPGLVKILQGCELSDVANIILTIDPCISCCER